MKTRKIISSVSKSLLVLHLLLLLPFAPAVAQDGFNTGVHVSTSFQLMTHRNKGTGIWASESGYGFSLGVPLRFGYADKRAFVTGLDYEFMAFDNWANGNLIYSSRFHSLHIPLQINFDLISSWFLSTGAGANLTFRYAVFQPGNTFGILNTVNPFQPYLSLGVGSLSQRGSGLFELGIQARYHFLDNWKKESTLYNTATSKVLSLDLVMRFYL